MSWIAFLARLFLAAVFLVAALGKLADRRGSRRALTEFGVPRVLAAPVAAMLPVIELAVAALLVPRATARSGAIAAMVLLGVFIVAIGISLARGRQPDCHCFGQLHSAPVGWSTLARNGAFIGIAAVALRWGGESPGAIAVTPGAVAWIALAAALIALVLALAEGWLLLEMLPQQGRILSRLETVEGTLGVGPVPGLAVGEQAPAFELRDVDGERRTLSALRATGIPVLLVFTNPDCPPCDALLPDVARWQREYEHRVAIAVIGRGAVEVNRAKAERHGLRTVLVQRNRAVSEAYDIDSTPSAVLIDTAGRIASRIGRGGEGIEALLHQAVGERGAGHEPAASAPGGSNGRHAPEPAAPVLGEPAPPLVLPDLHGRMTDLAELRGAPAVVLFWSPSCGYCQQMLPELKSWERRRPPRSPRVILVSSGTADANRAMGLDSPIVLDADGSAMRRFGADGTPMGVLVDADGRIASPLAVGARGVMSLLARAPRNEPARG
ncbi:MAG TPA: MauE/DoxX family redox-associated membrane protein [Gemmatimonadaceae bacterium]